MMPVGYWTGMSQPPKSTILAPAATCCAWKGVRRSGAAPIVAAHWAHSLSLPSPSRMSSVLMPE